MARKPIDTGGASPEPVGYGRPPARHRIRNGEVRNPFGRRGKPKPPVPFLEEMIAIRVDGEPRRMTRGEALDFFLFAKATKGDVRAIRHLEDRSRQRQLSQSQTPTTELSPEEQEAFDRYVRRASERLGEDGSA